MSSSVLDDLHALRRLDSGGMLAAIEGLPQQCRQAWREAQALALPEEYRHIGGIVILGLGGSAIAGDVFRVLLRRESTVPVFNHRQYGLPPYIDHRTLVVASSFSGNTEETLQAFRLALATPAKKLVVTAGGQLLATARANGVPAFVIRFRGEPRAALGWSLMPLLAVAERLGLMQNVEGEVEEAVAVMEGLQLRIGPKVPAEENPAKRLAHRLHGRLPVIYGADPLTEAAHRWKTQLNEVSKAWAFYEELPEANHNALAGYGLPEAVARLATVVFLRSADLHPRVLLRFAFTQRTLSEAGADFAEVSAEGKSALAQILSLVLFGDYVSYYLAVLNGVSPTAIPAIERLKAWLARQPW